jgi:DNA-binding Lrp family transcriptional regulator
MSDSEESSGWSALDTPIRRLRLLSRLAIALLLDLIDISRAGRQVIDTLLLGVIVQANRTAASGGDAAAPGASLRPITVSGVAASLGLPFETTRRRVRKLVDEGLCRAVSGGVIVPSAVLGRPDFQAASGRLYARLQLFYHEVSDLNLLPELPAARAAPADDARLVVTTVALAGEYVLREVAGLLETMGGPLDGLIAFEVFRANTAHFPHYLRGGEGYAAEDMVEDDRRRPVRVAEVAARLGMPHETVRRHVLRLVDSGVCRRAPGGVIMPAEVFARANVRTAVFSNAANLHRLFAALARLGVLELWERTRGNAPQPGS